MDSWTAVDETDEEIICDKRGSWHKCGNDRGFLTTERCGSAVTGMCEVRAGLPHGSSLHSAVASIPGSTPWYLSKRAEFRRCRRRRGPDLSLATARRGGLYEAHCTAAPDHSMLPSRRCATSAACDPGRWRRPMARRPLG